MEMSLCMVLLAHALAFTEDERGRSGGLMIMIHCITTLCLAS